MLLKFESPNSDPKIWVKDFWLGNWATKDD